MLPLGRYIRGRKIAWVENTGRAVWINNLILWVYQYHNSHEHHQFQWGLSPPPKACSNINPEHLNSTQQFISEVSLQFQHSILEHLWRNSLEAFNFEKYQLPSKWEKVIPLENEPRSFTTSSLFFTGLPQRCWTPTVVIAVVLTSQPKQRSSKEKSLTCSCTSFWETPGSTLSGIHRQRWWNISSPRPQSTTTLLTDSTCLGRRIKGCLSPLSLALTSGVQACCHNSKLEVVKSFHSDQRQLFYQWHLIIPNQGTFNKQQHLRKEGCRLLIKQPLTYHFAN